MEPKSFIKPRLQRQMVIYIVLVLTVLMVLTTLTGIRRERQGIFDQMQKDGVALAKSYALSAENSLLVGAGLGRLTGEASRTRGIEYLKILDRDCRIIGHTDVSQIGRYSSHPLYQKALQSPITAVTGGREPIARVDRVDGGDRVYRVIVPLVILDSVVGLLEVGLDMTGIAQATRRTNFQSLMIALAAVAFGGAYIWFFARSLTRPIRGLVNAAERVASGDLDHEISVRTDDEVGHLAASFNRMTRRLREYTGNLIRINEQLQEHSTTIERLRRHNENILASIRPGVLTVDRAGFITTVNPAGAGILQVDSNVVGMKYAEVFGPEHPMANLVDQGQAGQLYHAYEFRLEWPGPRTIMANSTFLLDQDRNSIGLVVTLEDITEIRELQRRIQESEKFAAMGELAAGVAHEVRNPLGSVKTCAQFLHGLFDPNDPNIRFTELIIRETDRLNQLVERLLNFTRPSAEDFQYENINELVDNAVILAELKVNDHRLVIERSFARDIPGLFADARRLQLGLLNIMTNAIDAMPDGGVIHVATEYEPSSRCIRIAISDTGEGIPEERLGKVFAPFFTTRPTGTGLGLAIAQRVVTEHGGAIDVQSRVGLGTTFIIRLPMTIDEGLSGESPEAGKTESGF